MNEDIHKRICAALDEDVAVEQNQEAGRWVADAGQTIVVEELEETPTYSVYAFPGAGLKHQGQPAETLSTDNPDEVVQHIKEDE